MCYVIILHSFTAARALEENKVFSTGCRHLEIMKYICEYIYPIFLSLCMI